MASFIELNYEQNVLVQEYRAQWKISEISHLDTEPILTPAFSPINTLDVKFCFKICHFKMNTDDVDRDYFKLTLLKFSGTRVPDDILFDLNIDVAYNNQPPFDSFSMKALGINAINAYICFEISDFRKPRDYLILDCHFTFFNHLTTPSEYYRNTYTLTNLKMLTRRYKEIFTRQNTDVTIKIGNVSLAAHKSLLAAFSPVFKRIFESECLETNTSIINITDCDVETFKLFLNFLYCAELVDSSLHTLKNMCVLADKYDVAHLKEQCIEKIRHKLDENNVCEILTFSENFNLQELKSTAVKFVVHHFRSIALTEKWVEFIPKNPELVKEIIQKHLKFKLVEI